MTGGRLKRVREYLDDGDFCMTYGDGVADIDFEAQLKFHRQEADVLLSTAIIESGLDIPNANTIFVDRADTFGLAQLYQLRGRVGRASH